MTTRKQFYNSKAWWECRGGFIKSKDFICERCNRVCWTKGDKRYKKAKAEGHDVVFGIVHHKQYLNETNVNDVNVSLNWENLEYLCIDCHNKEHMIRNNHVREDVKFDEYGNIKR